MMSDGGTNGDDGRGDGRNSGNREQNQQDDRNRQDERDEQGQGDRQGQQNRSPSTAEKALTVLSIGFTVLLFGYIASQAVQPPAGVHPQAEVVGTEQLSRRSVVVHVKLTNPGNEGLISATVEASCGQPPPDTTFDYVPAGGRERGVLVCPQGTTNPTVSVSAWVPT